MRTGREACAPPSTPDIRRSFSATPQSRTRCGCAAGGSTLRVGQSAASYSDHGASGASHLRAGYQALLLDAREQKCDAVVAESLDRLSRDQEHVAGLYKVLSFHGVVLLTIGEGEISELHVGLKGAISALYLKDLAQKTRRGLEGAGCDRVGRQAACPMATGSCGRSGRTARRRRGSAKSTRQQPKSSAAFSPISRPARVRERSRRI